jgi:hypothetical protein
MSTFQRTALIRALMVAALAVTGLTTLGSAARAETTERCGPPMNQGGDHPRHRGHGPSDGMRFGGEEGGYCYPSYDGWKPTPDRGGHVDEPQSDGDPSSDHATCRSGHSCSVSPPAGADSRFTVEASGGDRQARLFGTTNGGDRPNCPDYAERNADWLQFGFTEPARGAAWSKVVSMTERRSLEQGAALQLRDAMQICFAAPYSFNTRDGYGLGRDGSDYVGVLPDCSASSGPCLARREIVQAGDGYTVRFTFRIPANALDPKALG